MEFTDRRIAYIVNPHVFPACPRTWTAACTHHGREQLWDAVPTSAAVVLILHL